MLLIVFEDLNIAHTKHEKHFKVQKGLLGWSITEFKSCKKSTKDMRIKDTVL